MYRIGKRFGFDAAHHLPGLPEGHKCGRLHGHTYTVEVVLVADNLVGPGFVTDFADLAPFGAYLNEVCDHQVLNERLPVVPTSELLARHFAEWITGNLGHLPGRLWGVRVAETPSSWAEYRIEPAP